MSLRTSPWRIALGAMAACVLATPAVPRAAVILCGETLSRTLGSAPEEIGFVALPGEVVSATVVAAPDSSGFVPRWRIADVEGRPVLLSNGDHRCAGRCETAPLPPGIAFSLRIADSGTGTGPYVVSLEAVSGTADGLPNGPPLPVCFRSVLGRPDGTRPIGDEPLDGSIDGPGETDTFTLAIAAGESLHVTLGPASQSALDPVWQAFDDAGTAVAKVDDGTTAPFAIGGVATVLVTDRALHASGEYVIQVGHDHASTTTTIEGTSTSSTTVVSTTSTTVDNGGSTTSSTAEPSTTTTPASSTSTTTAGGGDTTTSTVLTSTSLGSSTVSTSSSTAIASTSSTTTATVAGPTTSTLAPTFDLETVFRAPARPSQGGLGAVLAVANGRLFIGAPHENVGPGSSQIRDAGAVLVVNVAGAVGSPTFGRVGRVTRPDGPAPGDALGASLAVADGGVVAGAPGARVALVVPDPTASHAVTIPSPSAALDDDFGRAVAAPDGLVVVGAPGTGNGAGVAYVFARGGGAVRTTLAPPAAIAGAHFGATLASSGTLVLVGAPGGDGVPGRAYLFDAATGALLQTIAADTPDGGDGFGAAVGFAGDDLVIGVPGANGGRGRVDRFDAATDQVIRSYAAGALADGDRFGASLFVADDRLIVGAPGVGNDFGAAYVFDLAGGLALESQAKVVPADGDALGTAVAIAAGLRFVGAPGDDAGTIDGGSVYVFDGETLVAILRERLSVDELGDALAATADGGFYVGAPGAGYVVRVDPAAGVDGTLAPPDGRAGRFGSALAALGNTIVVGAPETSGPAGQNVGVVYLFDGTTLRGTIQNPASGAGDEFGFAVGSLDGDVLASAPTAGEADTGLAYRLDPTGRLMVTYGKPVPATGDFFGAALAGDQGQVLVGAPFDASGGDPAGAVYLFDGDSAAIVLTIRNPTAARDLFGASVALGPWIVVGAPLAADGLGAVGTVWVFDRATGALVRRLENPRGGSFDGFGASLALHGDELIVGAPGGDDGAGDAGLVYVFETATGQLIQTFRDPPQTSFDHFGAAVTATDAGILIGSPGPSRIYFFDPIVPRAGFARMAAAPLVATASSICGNGLVEPGEACDDGNDVDTDDCRNDCTPGLCCTLDQIADAAQRCDDGDPCTTDILDPVAGCRYESSGAPGCCERDSDCISGECRVCVGCFIYHWDCCGSGSSCVPSNVECGGKTCVDAALCQCQGKLDCGDEAMPELLRTRFDAACDALRRQQSVSSDGKFTHADLVVARRNTRHARARLRKTLRMARKLQRHHEITAMCRKKIVAQVGVVRRAIPKGKKLRRCLISPAS